MGVGVMPQLYKRDVAITAVFCFSGGVGLTLLVVLICYQAFRRKKLKECKRKKEEEEGGRTLANHHACHHELSVNRRDVLLQTSSVRPWDRETGLLDTRYKNHSGQFRSRVDEDSSHFRCPDCCNKGEIGMGKSPMRWNKEMEIEEEIEKRGMKMISDEERTKAENQQEILSRNIPNKLFSPADSKCSSHQWRETFSERAETLPTYETGRDIYSYRINVEGKSTGCETLHCESCHRTYRPPQQNIRPWMIDPNIREVGVFDGFPPQHKLIDKGRNHNQFDGIKNKEPKRGSKKVMFDLESLRTLEQENNQGKDKWAEEARTSRHKEKDQNKRQKTKTQYTRQLKVKLNLNPLGKSKVHPKRKHKQNHSEKSSYKKNLQIGPVQYQGSGLVLGSSELPFKNPFSLSAAESIHTTSLPLLASAGSQLTGSSVSLQGGNVLLSTMSPAFNPLLSSGPAYSAAPNIAISGPNLASTGSLGSFGRQTGVGLMHTATSLLANTVQANPLQAGAIQSAPPQNSQAGALVLNLATNPSLNPEPIQFLSQSQMPDSSPLVGRLKSDPAQGPDLQTTNGLHQLPPESQVPQSTQNLPVQAQAPPDGLSGVTFRALGSGTDMENLSTNSQTEAGQVPGGSAYSMLTGGAALAEGPEVGVSGDNTEAANVSISSVSGSSPGDAPLLLHQEYLSEEGDSSPKRKLRLALPEKTSSRPPTAMEKKIR
ncbi:hypothetical protein Q8A73_015232 [Channa argus]|nr:hypothetical protein Q8A73_015232 [Channa argus]